MVFREKYIEYYMAEIEEEWRNAIEEYEVSNLGNVRRRTGVNQWRTINGSIICQTGYRYFQLRRGGKRINYLFHHLVAEAFIGPRPEGLLIDHIDRNKLNNAASNLRYCTPSENVQNSPRYLSHITETDPVKRRRLVRREWAKRNRVCMKLYNEICTVKHKLLEMIQKYNIACKTRYEFKEDDDDYISSSEDVAVVNAAT